MQHHVHMEMEISLYDVNLNVASLASLPTTRTTLWPRVCPGACLCHEDRNDVNNKGINKKNSRHRCSTNCVPRTVLSSLDPYKHSIFKTRNQLLRQAIIIPIL